MLVCLLGRWNADVHVCQGVCHQETEEELYYTVVSQFTSMCNLGIQHTLTWSGGAPVSSAAFSNGTSIHIVGYPLF